MGTDWEGILMTMVWELPLGQLTDKLKTALVTDTVVAVGEGLASSKLASKPIWTVSPGLMGMLVSINPGMTTVCALAAGASQSAESDAMNRATIRRASNGNVVLVFIAFLLEKYVVLVFIAFLLEKCGLSHTG
jgi:hypothetical protein